MRKRIVKPFDVDAAIPAAWNLIWAAKAKARAEEGDGYRARNLYTTASDVENQVRQFAIDDAEGRPRGTIAWGKPSSWPPVRIHCARGTLNGLVRDWLLDNVRRGHIHAHNFDRGHISGMRFRPLDVGTSEAEQATIAAKREQRAALANGTAKPRPVHLRKGGHPACVKASGWRQSKAHMSNVPSKVTCPRCAKFISPAAEAVA